MTTTTKIRGFKIRLRKREILRYLRSSGNRAVEERISEKLHHALEECYSLVFPSALYRNFHDSPDYESFREELRAIPSELIREPAKKMKGVSVMAVTVGQVICDRIDEVKEDLSYAAMLDACASEAVEQSANFISRIIENDAAAGEYTADPRISPGFADLDITYSAMILDKLRPEKIDLELSSSNILVPRKSVTALQFWYGRRGRR